MRAAHQLSRISILSILTTIVFVCAIGPAGEAQTQASCTFNMFPLDINVKNVGAVRLAPAAINDFGTIVGTATLFYRASADVGFIRWSNGGIDLPLGKTLVSSLVDRSDSGISIGSRGPFRNRQEILLLGTTVTPIVLNKNNIDFLVSGINKWESIVGTYFTFTSGRILEHGFKRWKSGGVITIDFPGTKGTTSLARINDNGTIIGNFNSQHGFIYQNGSFAQLDYPGSMWTALFGISNANFIVGNTNANGSVFPFLYRNGAFKVISPAGALASTLLGISPKNNLIVGTAAFINDPNEGFIATCE